MFPLFLTSFKLAFQTAVLFLPSVASLLGFPPSVLSHFHSIPSKLFPLPRAFSLSFPPHTLLCAVFSYAYHFNLFFFPLPRTFYSSNTFPLSLWPVVICTHWHATIFCPSPMFIHSLGTTLPSTGREQGEWLRDDALAEEDVEGQGRQTGREEGNPSAKLQAPCTPLQMVLSLSCHSELFNKPAFLLWVSLMMVSATISPSISPASPSWRSITFPHRCSRLRIYSS